MNLKIYQQITFIRKHFQNIVAFSVRKKPQPLSFELDFARKISCFLPSTFSFPLFCGFTGLTSNKQCEFLWTQINKYIHDFFQFVIE